MNATRLKTSLWFLSPLALAYALQGAKTGPAFLLVFLSLAALFFFSNRFLDPRPVPRAVLVPFVLLLLWLWVPLVGRPPLDVQVFFYSRAFLYVMAGLVAYQFFDANVVEDFERTVLLVGCLEALFVVVAKVAGHDPQSGGYLGNSLHSGLVLSLAFAGGLSIFKRVPEHQRWGYGLAILFLVVGILLVRSRAALLSTLLISFYFFPRRAAWISLGVVVLFGVLFALQGDVLMARWKIDSFGHKLTSGRVGIWLTALDAIRARPLTGYGLGNFETAYRLFQHPSGEYLRYGKSTMFAHNGFLQVAADAGVPALALLLWAYAATLKKAATRFRKERFLFALVLVFFLNSLFNYSLFLPYSGLVFALAMGCLAARTWPLEKTVPLEKHLAVPGVAVGLLSLFLVGYAVSDMCLSRGRPDQAVRWFPPRADAWYALAMKNIHTGAEPVPALEGALERNPQDGFVWQRLALVLAHQQPAETARIQEAFDHANSRSPVHAPFYVQQGFYSLRTLDDVHTETLFKTAAALEPAAPVPHYGLAILYNRQKRFNEFKAELEQMDGLVVERQRLEKDPQHAGSYREMFGTPYASALFDLPKHPTPSN